MNELFQKSIRTLELPRILELLAQKAVSDEAKTRCLRLSPAEEFRDVQRLLDETDAARERLGLHGSPPFSGVKDVAPSLHRADQGGMLNTRELLDIAALLTAARRVADYDAERQGEPTAIDSISTEDAGDATVYDLQGRQLKGQPSKGISIIRQKSGEARKVIKLK